jgi:hypothetical protein
LFLFLLQKTDKERLLLLVGESNAYSMVSFPLQYVFPSTPDFISTLFIEQDRVQPRNIAVMMLSMMFFLKVFFKRIYKRNIYSIMFAGGLLIIFLLHDYSMTSNKDFISLSAITYHWRDHVYFHSDNYGSVFSIFQAVNDYIIILGALSVFIYMRSPGAYIKLVLWRELFFSIMFLMSLIVILDVIVTSTGIVEWSTSYRQGWQGMFYGMELLFSFSLGIVLIYLYSLLKGWYFKFLFILIGVFVELLSKVVFE